MNTRENNSQWMVVTDLDGTLLNHDDYSVREAKPALRRLKQSGIPVIINSSKTAVEIDVIRKEIDNTEPFIVENGSAIFIPKQYTHVKPEGAIELKHYWEIVLGKPRKELVQALDKVPDNLKQCFQSYEQSSIEDVMSMTGLTKKEAIASKARRYSEPLKWHGTTAQKSELFTILRKNRIHHTEGGRFIHLLGHTNKGSAIRWLKNYFEELSGRATCVVAMGDAENDVDMFTTADVAGVVRSPVNSLPQFEHPKIIISKETGAAGWAEIIDNIFTGTVDKDIPNQEQEWLTSTKTVS